MEFAHARSLSPQTQQFLRQRAVASVVERREALPCSTTEARLVDAGVAAFEARGCGRGRIP